MIWKITGLILVTVFLFSGGIACYDFGQRDSGKEEKELKENHVEIPQTVEEDKARGEGEENEELKKDTPRTEEKNKREDTTPEAEKERRVKDNGPKVDAGEKEQTPDTPDRQETKKSVSKTEGYHSEPPEITPPEMKPPEITSPRRDKSEKRPGIKPPEITSPELVSPEITINVTGEEEGEEELEIIIPDKLLFEFDQSNLKPAAKDILEEINEEILQELEKAKIIIKGHTCNLGPTDYNYQLSKQRARSVLFCLEEKVESGDIEFQVEAYGDTRPAASNETEEGRRKNRRVELIVIPES